MLFMPNVSAVRVYIALIVFLCLLFGARTDALKLNCHKGYSACIATDYSSTNCPCDDALEQPQQVHSHKHGDHCFDCELTQSSQPLLLNIERLSSIKHPSIITSFLKAYNCAEQLCKIHNTFSYTLGHYKPPSLHEQNCVWLI
jgi:hypothetical protein